MKGISIMAFIGFLPAAIHYGIWWLPLIGVSVAFLFRIFFIIIYFTLFKCPKLK